MEVTGDGKCGTAGGASWRFLVEGHRLSAPALSPARRTATGGGAAD